MEEKTLVSRRTLFLGTTIAAVSIASGQLFIGSIKKAFAEDDANVSSEYDGSQFGFLVNSKNCVNCSECVKACRRANETPKDLEARRKVASYISDFGKEIFISTSCMHCESPSCLTVCPAGAISKRSDGIVVVNQDRCIGCKYCYQACPFNVPHYSSKGMDKCDYCIEAGVAVGEKPNCVKACIFGALRYGTIEDLEAKSHGTTKRVEAPTDPSLLLI